MWNCKEVVMIEREEGIPDGRRNTAGESEGTNRIMMPNSSFCQIRSRNLFKGKMWNIRANAGMFHGNSANLSFSVQIDYGVVVQLSGFCHLCFSELDVESIRISKIFHFHSLNPRSKKALWTVSPSERRTTRRYFFFFRNQSPSSNASILLDCFLERILNYSFNPAQFDYRPIGPISHWEKILSEFQGSSSTVMDFSSVDEPFFFPWEYWALTRE